MPTFWPVKKRKQQTRDCTKDPVTTELIQLIGSTTARLLKAGLPPDLAENIWCRSIENASFRTGHEDNGFTSIFQANASCRFCFAFTFG